MHRGYIKEFRKIVDWEWYTDYKTCHLFRHCILKANIEDKIWRGKIIKKGSFVTSLEHLSNETGLSVQNIRTSLKKLTSELTSKTSNQNSIITVKNFEIYQALTSELTNNQHANQQTTNKQLTTTKECKNIRKEKEINKEKEILENFESFWKLYPRKKSKETALRAYKKSILAADSSTIMNGLKAYLEEIRIKQTTQEYIKHPATWLNQKCWEDEYITNCIKAPFDKPITNEKGEIDLNVYNPRL